MDHCPPTVGSTKIIVVPVSRMCAEGGGGAGPFVVG